MKRLLATLLALVAAPLLMLVTPAPATAASPQVSSTATIRYCINTALAACKSAGNWSSGSATMVCWKDGSSFTGTYSSKRWFYLSQGSKKGWAHSSYVTSQATVPNCSTNRGVSIATWAATQVGEVNASATEVAYMWGAGSDPRWSGGCAGLASASVHFGVGTEPRYRGNAGAMYDSYRNAGLMQSGSSTPSVGSFVFWRDGSTFGGHVAVYVGNGYVATTWGYVGDSYANRRTTVASIGSPSGWVKPTDA